MTERSSITLKNFYHRVAQNNVRVTDADEYIRDLTSYGYFDYPFSKNVQIPDYMVDIVIAAEHMHIVSKYNRKDSLQFVLQAYLHEHPDMRLDLREVSIPHVSVGEYFIKNNENLIIGTFVALMCIGIIVGFSFLVFPHNGFISTEKLLGSVTRLYVSQ